MSEAVPLAHALVARLAQLEGVRILFIKGPTAVALGARPPRPSTDVDVLCEPAGLERLGPALERCGWRRREHKSSAPRLRYASKYLFEHSVHYIHDEWPCDLDIHFNFPGFLAPDGVVFEALWRRHTTIQVAHWPVRCADLLGQAAIVALHGLRDPQSGHTASDLDFVRQSLRRESSEMAAELAALAVSTGSCETLQPLLAAVDAPDATSAWSDPELLRRWQVRREHSGAYRTFWLIELRHTRWRERPLMVRRALLMPVDELYSRHVGLPRTGWNTARLHVARWMRAVRYLPRGLRASRRAERQAQ